MSTLPDLGMKEIGDDGEEIESCKSARGITGHAEPDSEPNNPDTISNNMTVTEPVINEIQD